MNQHSEEIVALLEVSGCLLAGKREKALAIVKRMNAAPGDGKGAAAYLMTRPSGTAWPLMPKDVTPEWREACAADGTSIQALYLAAPSTATAAREQEQRERMNVRFANRPASAATADFDLPAASDAVAEREREAATFVLPHLQERLQDHTCERVEHVNGAPGLTLYVTKLGAHPEFQLFATEAFALWRNLGIALAPILASRPEAPAAPSAECLMADMVPPATSRDRWMYEQGRLAERDPRSPGTRAALIEECCALIKSADDEAVTRDYMLDSDDCISVLRGTWPFPIASNPQSPDAAALAGMQPVERGEGPSGKEMA